MLQEKGLFKLYLIPIVVLGLVLVWLIYRKQWQNLVRPVNFHAEFSGAPQYVAGITSGSPLSELGSHCGFKSVPEKEAAACSAFFTTVTSFGAGRICDFAVRLYRDDGSKYFKSTDSRRVHLRPYCIEELARDHDFIMHSKLYFLQHNLAVLHTEWKTLHETVRVKPVYAFLPNSGRDLENPYPHSNGFTFFRNKGGGLFFSNYHRFPGLKVHAFFLPSNGEALGNKKLQGQWVVLEPGETMSWSVIISFSADGKGNLVERAERGLRNLDRLKKSAEKRWASFEDNLPLPCDADSESSKATLNLAAWALQNNLYYPRNKMKGWGSVPSKVYFPFIWGWDTPQHVLGLSEWNPYKASEVLLTQLEGNQHRPRKLRFKIKIKGITIFTGSQSNQIPSKINDSLRGVLDFYSQPPLQSWAAIRVYERFQKASEKSLYLQKILPLLRENLNWWENNRRLGNGFFSYINGLESGLDDSPRFYPPSFLPSFIIGLMPRFFCAVDLNCWLYQAYMNVAYLCSKAGLVEANAHYLENGMKLKTMIDEELWSPGHEAWLDRRNGSFIEVITPSIWWPAFVGASFSLEKIRTVIEKYLLEPGKFWGKHGIPSVAFDDDAYNRRKDGYYWRGQIWMINNYAALEVLFRFGYIREAAELHERVIETIYASAGLYETYDAETGLIGWSSRGPGDPAVMQFGMSSAWATQILLCRYQHFRYIFSDTTGISGHIQWATTFDQSPVLSPPSVEEDPQNPVLQVHVPGAYAYSLPKLFIQSRDGKPLLESEVISFRFEDPAGCTDCKGSIVFTWRGEKFPVVAGKSFMLRPFAGSGKLTEA